jgi:nucleoid-associated protein YgaU
MPVMARIVVAVRMLVGLSMVAGGVVLVTPLASRLVAAVSARQGMAAPEASVADVASAGPLAAAPPAGWQPPAAEQPIAQQPELPQPSRQQSGFQQPDLHQPGVHDPVGSPFGASAATAAGGMMAAAAPDPEPPSLQREYRPPPPPAPLGAVAQEFALPPPGMPDLYRAAHGAPPPPLLDGPRSEPGLGPGTQAAAVQAAGPPHPWHDPATTAARSTYRVRDGDDLVGIAARLYGHPAAARAVWEANRDRLADPGLLPIGLELRLPAPWEIDLHSATSAAAIEPRRSAAAAATWNGAGRPADPAVSWLGNAGPAATPAAWPGPQPATPPAGRRVVVAPGETLVSLAERFYGDPLVARRIWEANRDRLRSPELLVPGMELRLP